MARRPATPDLPPEDLVERIVDIDVATEMEGSFLEYAYSVIYSRALPDARDGLKPVQRRILYQMSDMGLRPDRPYVKSARVVGEVMGKLHPHGDAAIYDAMVRLAQPFSLRLPLVDGHGNFGSLDDGPAAPRYTEARMAPAALAMTTGLDEDVVDFVPNYDNKLTQPEVLPAAIPNLLVNGASGIAVGMATNMAPHNLVEVVAAARHLVLHPDATLEDLLRFVPGPDLPSGGKIVGLEGVRDAYRTGRGAFRTRATARIENVTPKRKGIVITELPYTVGPEKVIEKIKEGVQSKKLSGISDAVDLTDRQHGLRLVIEIKTGFVPEAVLEQLYRYTPLEDSFSINNVALVDGQPRTLGLRELLRRLGRAPPRRGAPPLAVPAGQAAGAPAPGRGPARRDPRHRRGHPGDPHVRRRRHRPRPAAQRVRPVRAAGGVHPRAAAAPPHPVLPDRAGEGAAAARRGDRRAAARSSPTRPGCAALVSDEMAEVAATYGTPRRTILLESAGGTSITGRPGRPRCGRPARDRRHPVLGAAVRHRAARPHRVGGPAGARRRCPPGQARRRGRVDPGDRARRDRRRDVAGPHRARLRARPARRCRRRTARPSLSGGVPLGEVVTLLPRERVVGLASLAADAPTLALATVQGTVKRVTSGDVPGNRDAWEAISLKDGDEVVGAVAVGDTDELVLLSSDASLLHFPASAVRPQGRAAGGMAGIKLAAGQRVVAFGAVAGRRRRRGGRRDRRRARPARCPGTQAGSAKVTPFEAYPGKGRATGGVRAHRFLRNEDALLLAWVGAAPAWATGSAGQPIELPAGRPAPRHVGHAAVRTGARHRLSRQTSATTLSGTGGRWT